MIRICLVQRTCKRFALLNDIVNVHMRRVVWSQEVKLLQMRYKQERLVSNMVR